MYSIKKVVKKDVYDELIKKVNVIELEDLKIMINR